MTPLGIGASWGQDLVLCPRPRGPLTQPPSSRHPRSCSAFPQAGVPLAGPLHTPTAHWASPPPAPAGGAAPICGQPGEVVAVQSVPGLCGTRGRPPADPMPAQGARLLPATPGSGDGRRPPSPRCGPGLCSCCPRAMCASPPGPDGTPDPTVPPAMPTGAGHNAPPAFGPGSGHPTGAASSAQGQGSGGGLGLPQPPAVDVALAPPRPGPTSGSRPLQTEGLQAPRGARRGGWPPAGLPNPQVAQLSLAGGVRTKRVGRTMGGASLRLWPPGLADPHTKRLFFPRAKLDPQVTRGERARSASLETR